MSIGSTIRVTVADGSSFGFNYLKRGGPSTPVIIVVPAMGTEARSYRRLLAALHDAGLDVACIDLRGYGSSSVRASRRVSFGYREIINMDLPEAFNTLLEVFPGQARFALGHSLGGQLLAMALTSEACSFDGLVFVASCCLHYRLWPRGRRSLTRSGALLARAITEALGYFPGKYFKFGLREGRQLMRDWEAQVRTGSCRASGDSRNFDALFARFSCPVLGISFVDDSLAPAGAIEGHLSKLTGAEVQRDVMRCSTSSKRSPHFQWLREPLDVVSSVSCFVAQTQNTHNHKEVVRTAPPRLEESQ